MKPEISSSRSKLEKFYKTRILVFVISYILIVASFISIFVFIPNFGQLTDPNLSLEVQVAAADTILDSHKRMWPALFLLVCMIGVHFFIVFNRFIGPLYRFSETFKKISKGDLSSIVKLRKSDYLTDERDEINRFISVLGKEIRKTKNLSDRSLNILERLIGNYASGDTEPNAETVKDLNELYALEKKLNHNLGFFRVSQETGENSITQ